MLRFRRIEIENFVVFESITIEPSTDPDRPLTVIRAENGSGKTTVLRALRWGMYGERGLPGANPSDFPVQPVDWRPGDDPVVTKVMIEFETDGSTRYDAEPGASTTRYRLSRSVRTIGVPGVGSDQRDFRRESEHAQLMMRESGGGWAQHTSGVDAIVDLLLPWELRDFFVMDADEATDFVGGSEGNTVSPAEVERKTTFAVHSLLGIDVFQQAAKRVDVIAREFGKRATKAVGESDLNELQATLDRLRKDRDELDTRLKQNRERRKELDGERSETRSRLDLELKGIGALEELRKRLNDNERRTKRAKQQYKEEVMLLAGELESPVLLASLMREKSEKAFKVLKPLYDEGLIPLKHLTFVRDLLERGTCVCGEDLSEDGIHRRRVCDSIAESEAAEDRANYLGQIHDAAKSAVARSIPDKWQRQRADRSARISDLRAELATLETDRTDINKKLDSVEEEKVLVLRDAIAVLDEQISKLDFAISEDDVRRPGLMSEIDSLDKRIQQRHKGNRAAASDRLAESISNAITKLLQEAYAAIQTDQVAELSQRMNRLFGQMVANVRDDSVDEERDKASVRNISEVGIRATAGDPDRFEIFALNARGRPMSPTEINGASRRVLALSFVLALCAESRTEAPLVADSLLNMMSGMVRRNTLRVTTENSSQPILLLTPADLSGSSELEIVTERAGATYTVTSQQDVVSNGAGEVVNRTSPRQISVICDCGPREYCDTCERIGQAGTPGLARSTRGAHR